MYVGNSERSHSLTEPCCCSDQKFRTARTQRKLSFTSLLRSPSKFPARPIRQAYAVLAITVDDDQYRSSTVQLQSGLPRSEHDGPQLAPWNGGYVMGYVASV